MDSSVDDKNIRQKFCRIRNRVERFKGDCLLIFCCPLIFIFLIQSEISDAQGDFAITSHTGTLLVS